MVKILIRIQWPEIVWALPPIYLSELRASGFQPVIGRRRAQGAGGGAFFVRVMEDIDVLIALFVLFLRVFAVNP